MYEQLSAAFEDPSATIVYPYVYRILNSSTRPTSEVPTHIRTVTNMSDPARFSAPVSNRPVSPGAVSAASSSRFTTESEPPKTPPTARTPLTSSPNRSSRTSVFSNHGDDDDPDAQLIKIIGNISSETTGALHKEGITQLHKFIKAYPHKKPRVDKMLDSTGPAFRKYIARALASRAAEDDERDVAVADTLSRECIDTLPSSNDSSWPDTGLEAVRQDASHSPSSPRTSSSPRRSSVASDGDDPKLSRLHDLFGYHGRPGRTSAGSMSGTVATSPGSGTVTGAGVEQANAIIAQLATLRAESERG